VTRRTVLRAVTALLPIGLATSCRLLSAPAPPPTPVPPRPLIVLAAYAGSPALGHGEPPWLPAVRRAVAQRNAAGGRGPGDAPPLALHVFTLDQAPGATGPMGGKSGGFYFGPYFDALARHIVAAADLALLDAHFPSFVLADLDRRHALMPVDPYLAQEPATRVVPYYPGTLSLGQVAGRQLALPLAVVPRLMRYDAGMFRAASVDPPPSDRPWTWQELIDIAPKFRRLGEAAGAATNWTCDVRTLGAEIPIWQASGDVLAADGTVLLDQPAAVRGIGFWRDLEAVYRLDPQFWSSAMPSPAPSHPYRITLSGANVAATTFEAPTAYDPTSQTSTYTIEEIAKHWDDGLAFAPVPVGLPGGTEPATKLELQLAGVVSAGSKQPRAAFAALRAIEAAAGSQFVVSASPPLAERSFAQGNLDARLVPALRWGLQVGRPNLADLIDASGTGQLLWVLPSIQGLPPAEACAQAARQLRCQVDSRQCGQDTAGSAPRPPRPRP
jgi:ABC-type glycerol-3-phosphate transport system substrate-binding protein